MVTSHKADRNPSAAGNQARADQTRAAIIDVAVEIVLKEGIAAASGRHIAETAGVTWGVIQYHFGDRDGLLIAVVDQSFNQLLDALGTEPPAAPHVVTRDRVEAVVNASWRALSSPIGRAASEILIGTRTTRGAAATGHIRRLVETSNALVTAIDRDLDPTRSAAIGEHLLTSLRGMVAKQLVLHRTVDTTADRQILIDILSTYIDQHHHPSSEGTEADS